MLSDSSPDFHVAPAKRSRIEPGTLIHSFVIPPSVDETKEKRALVIDDSLVVRKVVSTALSRLKFEVHQAGNGMEGLQKMQRSKFDLVLCDFLMPVMDGLDCVREYRLWESKHRPNFRQYIVGMSAHASTNDMDRGLSIGMDDYRSKPVNFDDLKCLKQNTQGMARCSSSDAMLGVSRTRASFLSYPNVSLEDASRFCLIASVDECSRKEISDVAFQNGWTCISAENGPEALTLLKLRNWGAAFVDAELKGLQGLECIHHFRDWEIQNRIHRQNNLFLLTDLGEATGRIDSINFVQVPEGVNGAMHRPPSTKHLEDLFRSFDGRSRDFGAADIVTW
jgi:CheY-like chemotaxis protein